MNTPLDNSTSINSFPHHPLTEDDEIILSNTNETKLSIHDDYDYTTHIQPITEGHSTIGSHPII
jgi:hypothetical protein